jgi:hypothetical protein
MCVIRVVVTDPVPLKLSLEILLNLAHHRPDVIIELKPRSLLWRHNETKVMRIVHPRWGLTLELLTRAVSVGIKEVRASPR